MLFRSSLWSPAQLQQRPAFGRKLALGGWAKRAAGGANDLASTVRVGFAYRSARNVADPPRQLDGLRLSRGSRVGHFRRGRAEPSATVRTCRPARRAPAGPPSALPLS